MCGIAGIVGIPRESARRAATKMLAAMQHRGPDGSGIQELNDGDNCVILLHTRLAILDLSSAGNQPMCDIPINLEKPANWIVFNGEIYNFLKLHSVLANAGWPCRTRCDTEVILNGFRVWGEAVVEQLQGMFAWFLVDTTEKKIWLCRDRLGIKPLYIYRPRGGGLLFASEIRTLLAAGEALVEPIINPSSLESFLAQGAVCGNQSIIAGIESLEPGQSLITDWKGQPLKSSLYWQLPRLSNEEIADKHSSIVADLGNLLRDSVNSHLISDVPIGIFLSGGIDSSSLATIAQEVSQTPVKTLTIGFDQKEFDESAIAEAIAASLGTQHQTIQLSGQTILDNLTEVLTAIDQPTVDGFNTYFVAKETKKAGLTVALSGLGGDELFGGYASFQDVNNSLSLRQKLNGFNSLNSLFSQASNMISGRRGIKLAEMWKRPPQALDMYLLRRELFMPGDRRSLHPCPENSDIFSGVPLSLLNNLRQQFSNAETLNQVSFFELSFYMRYMLLRDSDVFSMSSGLEIRVPLLDHKIVEFVFPLEGKYKYHNSQTKSLLVDAVGKNLPAIVKNQPKRGFKFPWDSWLRGALRDRVQVAINNQDVWQQLGFNHLAVAKLWQRFLNQDCRVSASQILAFLILEDYTQRHSLRAK